MKKESAQKLRAKIEKSGIHKYFELDIEVDEFDTDEYSVDLVSRKPLSGQIIDEIASELNKMAKEIDEKILDVDSGETFFRMENMSCVFADLKRADDGWQ